MAEAQSQPLRRRGHLQPGPLSEIPEPPTREAYELFWKSTWNKAWADAGYFEAACISVSQGRYDDALDELNRSLIFNSCNHKARALKAAVLRKLGRSGRSA